MSELEGVLDGVKSKLQDLEDSYIGKAVQQHSKVHQLQHDKRDAQVGGALEITRAGLPADTVSSWTKKSFQ